MSGWPSGVRGGVHFVAGSAPFVSVGWSRPATRTHADTNIVAIASDTRPLMRIYHLAVGGYLFLLLFRGIAPIGRRTSSRRTQEQLLSVGQRGFPAVGSIGPILGAEPQDRDLGSRRHRVLVPAAPEQRIRCAAFDHPCHDFPVRAFHVDVEPRVGIDPFHLGNGSFQRDRLGPVKFRRECMMRDYGCGSCQYEDAGVTFPALMK